MAPTVCWRLGGRGRIKKIPSRMCTQKLNLCEMRNAKTRMLKETNRRRREQYWLAGSWSLADSPAGWQGISSGMGMGSVGVGGGLWFWLHRQLWMPTVHHPERQTHTHTHTSTIGFIKSFCSISSADVVKGSHAAPLRRHRTPSVCMRTHNIALVSG